MTPLMKQYLSIKEAHRDCLLLFRLGDFYELFFEDAVVAAKLLQLTLTSRDKSEENPVPMCGVPHHAARGYIAKLIAAGHKVALCEQMEEPTPGKGIVRREVTQIFAPGTFLEEENLLPHKPNYLVVILEENGEWGMVHVDLSIGVPYISQWPSETLLEDALLRLDPRHVVIESSQKESSLIKRIAQALPHCFIEKIPLNPPLSAALHEYIQTNQPELVKTLTPFQQFSENAVMPIDTDTQLHLEIFKSYDGTTTGTLFSHLNHTRTPMGARLLRQWVTYPSMELLEITRRQNAVKRLLAEGLLRRALSKTLESVYDLERLQSKLYSSRVTPRDLIALKVSLAGLGEIVRALGDELVDDRLRALRERMAVPPDSVEMIERVIVPTPPISVKDGGVINEGVSAELDRLRLISRDGKSVLAQLERNEREQTAIPSLKIRYNKVFGYYIEITHTHKHKVPSHYVRKQTTVNSERYITEELKRLEDEILSAESRILTLEQTLFEELCAQLAGHTAPIRHAAQAVAELDVYLAFAELAEGYRYECPEMHEGFDLSLSDSRHPTLEARLPKGQVIASDVAFSEGDQEMILITGPNMAGKSTVMRQVALIAMMAQMGSFVPASRARLPILDRIFTRIGASDNLLAGKSTFMMEMIEAAEILKKATRRSLIILDEIGRGTSTFDGLSLARAIAEHLVDRVHAKVMFATHYHELAELESHYPPVKGFTMSVKEWQGEIIFLYRLVKGNSSRSYGIEVAKLAGLPETVIHRAKEVLAALEVGEAVSEEKLDAAAPRRASPQLDLFSALEPQALKTLKEVDINHLTPLQALTLLAKLKEELLI